MPNPFAPPVVLDSEESQRLQSLTRAHSTPQALVFRCRLILRLADRDQPSNLQVANEFGCSRNTVALWRTRYLEHGPRRSSRCSAVGSAAELFPPTNSSKSHAGLQQHQRARLRGQSMEP